MLVQEWSTLLVSHDPKLGQISGSRLQKPEVCPISVYEISFYFHASKVLIDFSFQNRGFPVWHKGYVQDLLETCICIMLCPSERSNASIKFRSSVSSA